MGKEEVADSARLEGAGGLEVFELEVDFAAGGFGECGGVD